MKSIGQFIATLRKANGMTQKQLAEMLNVSDKAISRWERDECSPDISLIPVIAEIFNVTSDEILRGERINREMSEQGKMSGKSDKQLEYLLNNLKTKLSIRSIIAVAIGLLGLLIALLCNFGFNRAYIGFMTGCILYLIAAVCETIFLKLALSSLANGDFDDEKIKNCKYELIDTAVRTYIIQFVLLGITLPLLILPMMLDLWNESYFMIAQDVMYSVNAACVGLTFDTWLISSMLFGFVAFLLGVATAWILECRIKGKDADSDKEAEKKNSLNVLRKRTVAGLGTALLITAIANITFNANVQTTFFVKGTTFKDMEKFKEHMAMQQGSDENGMIIQPDDAEAGLSYIHDKDGNVICEYRWNNLSVVRMDYTWKNNKLKAVTTYTGQELREGKAIIENIQSGIMVLYVLEIMATIVVYRIKKSKIS